MNIKWLTSNVTDSCWNPCQRRKWRFLGGYWHFLANPGGSCVGGAVLWYGNPISNPNQLIHNHSINLEWLMTNLTAVGSPVNAKSQVFWVIFDIILSIEAAFVLELSKPYFWSFNENGVVDYQCDSFQVPSQSKKWSFLLFWTAFWPIQAAFVVREPHCDLETTS